MPGEAYIQIILNQLNKVHVCGEEDIRCMIAAIDMLNALKRDIVEHKAPNEPAKTPKENV